MSKRSKIVLIILSLIFGALHTIGLVADNGKTQAQQLHDSFDGTTVAGRPSDCTDV